MTITNEADMVLQEYERLMASARDRFTASPGVRAIQSSHDGAFLESFLLHFCALGSRMTEPVERWIRRAAERCRALGLVDLANALSAHARAEAGHHFMMIADVRSLATHWNARRTPLVDANVFLSHAPSPGVLQYCRVHEENLVGVTPYAQIAIEYEVEMLPLRYGEQFISHCVEVLGPGILPCLSFVTEHIRLDQGHTRFNTLEMTRLLEAIPTCLPALVSAGTAVLDAYARFLADCAQLAERDSRNVKTSPSPPCRSLAWHVHAPAKAEEGAEIRLVPDWLAEVRSLRGMVLFADGRRPHFRSDDGHFCDPDPVDLHSYHILAYDGLRLVGCVRVYRLMASGLACAAEEILGAKRFSDMLESLGVQRGSTVEIGRWIVHPAYRANGRTGIQLAAASAVLAAGLESGLKSQAELVVCCAGTGDQQDLLLGRIGLSAFSPTQTMRCDDFNDDVCVMYCTSTKRLNAHFRRLMSEMAETIGLIPGQ
jgi:Acetyltransferase (GNAT) domain